MNTTKILKDLKPKDRTYKLVDGIEPPYRQIRSRHISRYPLMIIDSNGEQVELRYASNQKTPFAEEQTGFARTEHIGFTDGELETTASDINKQRFLAVHPDNVANGGIVFLEEDLEQEAVEQAVEYESKIDTLIAVKTLTDNEIEAIGYHEIGDDAFTEPVKVMRRDLYNMAEKNPKYLMELIDNNFIQLKGLGAKALHFKVMKLADNDRTVKWSSNSRKLISVPVDKAPSEALADYFLTDEGHEIRAKAEKELKKFE